MCPFCIATATVVWIAAGTVWSYLDLTPRRQELWEDSPAGYPQTKPYQWWNWHDQYVHEASPNQKWVTVSDNALGKL
jgi:hypothetical protein